MPKYIFLDTWVLSNYTKAEYTQHLVNFIKSNGYTVVFNGLTMAESHNEGWQVWILRKGFTPLTNNFPVLDA